MEIGRSLLDTCWCHIIINKDRKVQFANELARKKLPHADFEHGGVLKVLPWVRYRWLRNEPVHKIVKTSITDKMLLDIIPDPDNEGWHHLLFRNVDQYDNTDHLWCEVADSVIGVQKFIDSSYDGIVVADGKGAFLAVNDAFVDISGLSRQYLIGKDAGQLVEQGLIPFSCTLQTIDRREPTSAVIKYPHGKEAIVSSMPLFNSQGAIVRVLSNVRDISELKLLHEKLRSVKALATGFQRELKAMQAKMNTPCIHRSAAMDNLHDLLTKVAGTDLQLLITGESGVGKTALAKFIHTASERCNAGNFIHVNCSAIPENLLESELFGYEEGSFTGARKTKVGLFELADRGTIFLDEIGDMPLSLQAKILNVLQEEKFYRVGGTKEITVDVRVIAATNHNLDQLIAKGQFRQDLFYRLNVVPIRIPPLRERKDDVPPLVAHYLDLISARYKRNKSLSSEAYGALVHYDWPGNVRELINLIERLIVVVDEPVIELRHLPVEITSMARPSDIRIDAAEPSMGHNGNGNGNGYANGNGNGNGNFQGSLKTLIEEYEGKIIASTIARCGSLKEASKQLGVDVTTLIRKRKRVLSSADLQNCH